MEDTQWEYVNDNYFNSDDYADSMNDGTYLDDEYYETQDNEWENYYEEICDDIEY